MNRCLLIGIFISIILNNISAQNRLISGTVSTPTGESVSGILVQVEGKETSTLTDKDGQYKITVQGRDNALVFSRMGFVTQIADVNGRTEVNIITSQPVGKLTKDDSFVPTISWRNKRLAELTNPSVLFSRGETKVYRDEYLEAISLPVGGIGTGNIQMDGDARRPTWQLWRNFTNFELPNSFFAVKAQVGNKEPVVRALQTVHQGPFDAMKSLSFRGEYPFGWYDFEEPDLPVEISMEVFNPKIPLDAKNSAIPCAVYNFTVRNNGREPVNVSLLATQQNASGLFETMLPLDTLYRLVSRRPPDTWAVQGRSSEQYGGNRNQIIHTSDATLLYMTGKQPKSSPSFGEMVLIARDKDAIGIASWDNMEALYREFRTKGILKEIKKAGPSPSGQTLDGAIVTPFIIEPGEERTVSFILAWYFPNITMIQEEKNPGWKHDGYVYANWWPNGLALAKDLLMRIDGLTKTTRQFHESMYSTNLPYYVIDRISSQFAILSSATAFWAKDGHFGVWEGCSWTFGSCAANATHVWGYAQAVPRLFPEIGKIMREQEHAEQTDEGMLPVRLGLRNPFQAYDGQCHSILQSYLAYLQSPDGSWLKRQWPEIKKSMDYLIEGWDKDEDGMLSGSQHGMDESHGGTSSWMGSMYMAALSAAERMAIVQGDELSASRYAKIVKIGSKNQDEKLFNGEYYFQIPDTKPHKDYLTGCYTDQMLGQWWANLLDLGWIYPKEHVSSAMSALFKYNFKTDFYDVNQYIASEEGQKNLNRIFVLDNEPGMIQTTWPRGGRPDPDHMMLMESEVKVGITYAVAALMMDCGLYTEAFALTKANYDRYDGRLRTGLTNNAWSALGISGNPFGDDCAGKFYVRALSTWSLLLAAQKEILDGPKGVLGFDPTWMANDHKSFFTTGEGWGTFSQKRDESHQKDMIKLDWGQMRLKQLQFGLPEGKRPGKVEVRVEGKVIGSKFVLNGKNRRVQIDLTDELTMQPGQQILVSIDYI